MYCAAYIYYIQYIILRGYFSDTYLFYELYLVIFSILNSNFGIDLYEVIRVSSFSLHNLLQKLSEKRVWTNNKKSFYLWSNYFFIILLFYFSLYFAVNYRIMEWKWKCSDMLLNMLDCPFQGASCSICWIVPFKVHHAKVSNGNEVTCWHFHGIMAISLMPLTFFINRIR